jgi:hypothetical protein
MIRKSILALAAIAAIGGATIATSSDAAAKKGGWHGHHHHHHFGHRGFRVGFYGAPAYYGNCFKVITRRGYLKTVCSY